jgi:hypothetical protein
MDKCSLLNTYVNNGIRNVDIDGYNINGEKYTEANDFLHNIRRNE